MTYIQIRALQNRAAHYLSYEVARSAGLNSLAELQQFVAGTFQLSPEQLTWLARRVGFST
jgi:hypothetical protein